MGVYLRVRWVIRDKVTHYFGSRKFFLHVFYRVSVPWGEREEEKWRRGEKMPMCSALGEANFEDRSLGGRWGGILSLRG